MTPTEQAAYERMDGHQEDLLVKAYHKGQAEGFLFACALWLVGGIIWINL